MAKTRAEIQKDYRDNKRERLADNGGRVIKLEVYSGTDADIKYLMEAGGFEDERELLTILIRNAAKNIKSMDGSWDLLDI